VAQAEKGVSKKAALATCEKRLLRPVRKEPRAGLAMTVSNRELGNCHCEDPFGDEAILVVAM
jgi:hypothetical protein